MRTIEHKINIKIYDSYSELSATDLHLIKEAQAASDNAYAEYSKFQVGAAVLLEDGSIIKGNNQENAAYPSGLCAERVALFYASAQFPNKKIIAIAISAQTSLMKLNSPITPCAACRQVMLQYEQKHKSPIKILMSSNDIETVYEVNAVKDLIPLLFDGEDIKLGGV